MAHRALQTQPTFNRQLSAAYIPDQTSPEKWDLSGGVESKLSTPYSVSEPSNVYKKIDQKGKKDRAETEAEFETTKLLQTQGNNVKPSLIIFIE